MADNQQLYNSAGLNEAVVFAHYRSGKYGYRRGLGMLPSQEYDYFFDDFNKVVTSNVPVGWSAAIIDTGATLATYATAVNAGVVRITSDGASEGVSIYLPKTIYLTGKRFFMEIRAMTHAPTDTDLQFGLAAITATTNPEDLWTTTEASNITFGLLDGSAVPSLVYDSANAGPTTDAVSGTENIARATITADTWNTYAIAYNGDTTAQAGSVSAWVNGYKVVTNTATNVPSSVMLSPFIGARGGDGAIGTIDIDYMRYSIVR
jgi:hypothetical protein